MTLVPLKGVNPGGTSTSQQATPELCTLCQNITIESLRRGYGHEEKTDECPLCSLLNSLGQRQLLKLEEPMLPGLPPLLCNSSGKRRWKPIFVTTREDDPARDFGIPAITSPLPATKSESSLRFIKSCLQECLENHNCSQSMFRSGRNIYSTIRETTIVAEPEAKGPRRLIDVRAFCGDHDGDCEHKVQLVEDIVRPRYMTLSHCWGKGLSANAMTMTNNLPGRKSGIQLNDLPKNFRDAVSITRRLGIQYLWIDALCIVQDSQSDWAQESVKMGHIYDNSYLTIAASSSEDSAGGCYRGDGITQDKLGGGTLIEVTNKLASGQPTTLILWAPKSLSEDDPPKEPTPLISCPLSQRGWAFQERILSPRTIHFTRYQLVWECRELYKTEDGLPFVTAQETLSLSMNRRISPDMIKNIWYNWLIGFGYSNRKFTKMGDRLIAIAGIARSLHERTGEPYIAGLWKGHLGFGLSWLEKPEQGADYLSESSNASNPRRRPTWTWASTDHEFQYPSEDFEEDGDLRYLGSKIQTVGDVDDPFAVVVGGWLEIKGSVVDDRDHFNRLFLDLPHKEFSDQRTASVLGRKTKPPLPMSPPCVYVRLGWVKKRIDTAIHIDESWLVAQRVEANEEQYERIGIAYRSYTISPPDIEELYQVEMKKPREIMPELRNYSKKVIKLI